MIDNDGWEHADMTDLFGIHDYARTGDLFAKKYAVLDSPTARIPGNGRAALVPGYEYNGSPLFLSEFGGIAYHAGVTRAGRRVGLLGRREAPRMRSRACAACTRPSRRCRVSSASATRS